VVIFDAKRGPRAKTCGGNTNLDTIHFTDGLVLIATFLFWLFREFAV
jgi:hypothetical protein